MCIVQNVSIAQSFQLRVLLGFVSLSKLQHQPCLVCDILVACKAVRKAVTHVQHLQSP